MGVDVGIDGVEVSSEEQDKTIAKMLSKKNSFFIMLSVGLNLNLLCIRAPLGHCL